MNKKLLSATLCLVLCSVPAFGAACPDEKGDCYLHDLQILETQGAGRDSFSCPDGTFATGVRLASSIQIFTQEATHIFPGMIPITEKVKETHYVKPVNWFTQLHCEQETLDLKVPEALIESDPFNRKTLQITDLNCGENEVVSGITLLSHSPESEDFKQFRSYLKGVRLACKNKTNQEVRFTEIRGFDEPELFCKTGLALSPAEVLFDPFVTRCTSLFNKWDWQYTNHYNNLQMEFNPDWAHGFFPRFKWETLPKEGVSEENCPTNFALSKITLFYDTEKTSIIALGQNCRQLSEEKETQEKPQEKTLVIPQNVDVNVLQNFREWGITRGITDAEEKEFFKQQIRQQILRVEPSSEPEAAPRFIVEPTPEQQVEEPPMATDKEQPAEKEEPKFIQFTDNNSDDQTEEDLSDQRKDSSPTTRTQSAEERSWFSCSLHPLGARSNFDWLLLLVPLGYVYWFRNRCLKGM